MDIPLTPEDLTFEFSTTQLPRYPITKFSGKPHLSLSQG
jgi:hypothetical protein